MLEESVARASRRSALAVTAVVFAMAGFVLQRPNILGERFAVAGLALVLVAGFFVLLQDRGRATWGRPSVLLIILLGLAQAWALFRAPYNGIGVVAVITGSITTLSALVVFAFLFSSAERTRMFLRALVVGIVILCASSLITAVLAVAGVRIELFAFPITDEVAATVYFPFTATSGVQSVFGIEIPRFTGLGREPGWMAMYAAVAWLIWPRLFGSRFRVWRLLLVAGVLTPLSTAGFGIFVVVAAFHLFLRPRPGSGIVIGYARQVAGVAVLVFAVWLAVAAPVVGLEAKSVQNVASLDERNAATLDGLRALQELSLGEESASRIPGVNLIAAVAETGWPYSLLVALAVLLPLVFRASRRYAFAPVAVIFLTFLLAQPPGDSTAVFVLVAGVYALAALPDPSSAATVVGQRTVASRDVREAFIAAPATGAPARRSVYAAGALALVVVAVAVLALQPRTVPASAGPRPSFAASDFATASTEPTVAVFLGDSYTAGVGGTGDGFTNLVARGQEWMPVNLGRGGTGFVTPPEQDPAQAQIACGLDRCESYPEMIAAAVAADPDVVVVSGGRNDLAADEETAAAAVAAFFPALRAALPEARIIVTSPLWDASPVPAGLQSLETAIRSAAAGVGARYLDIGQPLVGHPEYLSDDGIHPNDRGYVAIATAIAAVL